jgi:hypothetical protein
VPETRRARFARRLPVVVAVLAAMVFAPTPAVACLVCITVPQRTLADAVIEADAVVLAREDATRPFAYAPVAILKGNEPITAIPSLVDSTTRRRLAADPDAAVLFAHDGAGWTRLGHAGPDARRMIEAILAAAPAWDRDPDHAGRFAFFAARHDHADPLVRELALAEISRAPYAQIRTMTPRLTRAQIVSVLRDPKWVDWAPIHILFLGLSDDPADHAFVRRAFDAAARGDRQLAAWATALAEIDGPPAIERLRRRYFEDASRTPEEVRAIVTAFATLARGGDPALRPGIDAAFRALASGPPALAAEAARQLAWAQDWSQAATFADLIASGALDDPAAEFVISIYLEAAGEALGPISTWAPSPEHDVTSPQQAPFDGLQEDSP